MSKDKSPTPNNQNLESSEENLKNKLKALLQKDIARNSKKLWIGEKFVEKPYLIIFIWAIIFIIGLILSLINDTFEMSEQNMREYLIWSHERVKDKDMQSKIVDEYQKAQGGAQLAERSQEESQWSTNLILSCEGDCNLFSKEGLKTLFQYEQQITENPDYKNVCIASVDNSECSKSGFLTISNIIQQLLDKPPSSLTDEDVTMLGNQIFQSEALFTQIKFFFDKEFTTSNRISKNLRSYMKFGTPVKVDGKLKKDQFEDRDDQIEVLNDFQKEILDIRDNSDIDSPSSWKFYAYSRRISMIELQKVVDVDTYWAIASVIFCLLYMSIHLRSLFLGGVVMIQILMSFPLTQCIFNLMLGITYFSSLHVTVIFIVLGISAANIFVFVDAWEQTSLYSDTLEKDPKINLNQRMALTYRRASKAMLATQSTTSAAFLATGFSNIMPISSFGIFAGILIIINFLLMILFFPAILIVHETKLKQNLCCCFFPKKQAQQDQENKLEMKKNETDFNFIEKFFDNQFNNFIQKFKYIILLVFIIWLAIAIWQALQIAPLSEPEKFLKDDHKSTIAKNKALYSFHPSASGNSGITLNQFWGVDDIDSSENSRWDSEALGKIEWDESFDISPEKNQQFFLDYCQNLKNNELVQDKRVDSFIFDFKSYAETETQEGKFPVKQENFFSYLKEFTKTIKGLYHSSKNRIGIIDDKLKYVQIKVSSIGTPYKPYDELNPLYEKWDSLITETNEKAPKGLKNSKQSAGIHWTWMITERAFVSNAVQGMLISLVFGLIVLLVATQNVYMALFSLFSIIGIVISVVCMMQILDWELGIAESITIVIVIGLSIDYVVHLANHYVDSVYPDRHRKIKVALRDLGISILSGALTTAGSGFFLFFADMIIFNKFATLILSTVFFSLLFSLFFFASLMHIIGPENNNGSITQLCSKKTQQSKQQQQNEEQNLQCSPKQNIVVEVEQFSEVNPIESQKQQSLENIDEDVEKHIVVSEPALEKKMQGYTLYVK